MTADVCASNATSNHQLKGHLIALSVLPAVWHGLARKDLAQSVADVLWGSLEVELVCLRSKSASHEDVIQIARSQDRVSASAVGQGLADLLGWEGDCRKALPSSVELSGLRIALWPVTWRGGQAFIAVASRAENLLTPHERMIVTMVANLARAAFQHAVVERSTDALDELAGIRPASAVREAPRRSGLAAWQVRRVTEFMCDHLDREIGLDDLAAILQLSRFHFCKAFRRATGQTPHEWFTSQRMQRARDLLLHSDLSISEIALSVGYKTPSAFSAVFRRTVRMTPSEYRNNR